MSSRNAPAHLTDYNPTDELFNWKKAECVQGNRSYNLCSWSAKFVKVTLNWSFDTQDSTQLGGLQKVAASAEEAVWLAMEEFKAWEEAWKANKLEEYRAQRSG